MLRASDSKGIAGQRTWYCLVHRLPRLKAPAQRCNKRRGANCKPSTTDHPSWSRPLYRCTYLSIQRLSARRGVVLFGNNDCSPHLQRHFFPAEGTVADGVGEPVPETGSSPGVRSGGSPNEYQQLVRRRAAQTSKAIRAEQDAKLQLVRRSLGVHDNVVRALGRVDYLTSDLFHACNWIV